MIRSDDRFQISAPRILGLVCFRLVGENSLTERLLKKINKQGLMHCVPASLRGQYVIRFTVTSTRTTHDDLLRDWKIVQDHATEILQMDEESRLELGTENLSLLLSNVPKIANFMNSSYAAFLEDEDWQDAYKTVRLTRSASGRYLPGNKTAAFSTELLPSSYGRKKHEFTFTKKKYLSLDQRSLSLQTSAHSDENNKLFLRP